MCPPSERTTIANRTPRRRPRALQRASAAIVGACAIVLCPPAAPAQSIARTQMQAEESRHRAALATAAYLRRLGLDELLAQHLERTLEAETDRRRRDELVERLASTYARLVAEAEDANDQRRWIAAGQDLLQRAPGDRAIELRLALAQSAYRQAEDVAERWIVRAADEPERQLALRRLETLEEDLSRIAADANVRVKALERREERSVRTDDDHEFQQTLAAARRHRSLAHYLAGWSAYYYAALTPSEGRRDAAARNARRHFGWLLNAEPGEPATVERLPEQTLRYEHVGRAAIACALTEALQSNSYAASNWLDAIEGAPDLAPAVREQLRARRIQVHASAGEWQRVEQIVEDARSGPDAEPLDVGEARLLAALTFAALAAEPRASDIVRLERLRDAALTDLVARDELGHVLDLASRFGADRLGSETFVAHQVRGLTTYRDARAAHEANAAMRRAQHERTPDAAGEPPSADQPTEDPVVAGRYRRAAAHFAAAIRSPDAVEFPAALGNTSMLLGLARFYAGDAGDPLPQGDDPQAGFLGAADAFERAAEQINDRSRAAAALWMAIRSLDLAIDAASASGSEPDEDMVLRRDRLIAQFLDRYRDNPRAAALVLRQSETDAIPLAERIELLLRVPASSDLYEPSRRQAARLLYEQARAAAPSDRDWLSARYADVAEPLLAIDRRRAAAGDAQAADRALLRARRIAELTLSMRAPDLDRAERAVGVLRSLAQQGLLTDAVALAEVDYRAAQIALARGDRDEAARLVEALESRDPQYAEAAERLFYRDAVSRWRRAGGGSALAQTIDAERADPQAAERLAAARDVARVGGALIERLGSRADESPGAVVSLLLTVARASYELWQGDDDRVALDDAVRLFQRVLERDASSRNALRGLALAADDAGLEDVALDAWRRLVAGEEPGSTAWFDAKTRQLELLAQLEPRRAAEALEQFTVLYPSFGPEPYATRLRELRDRLERQGARPSEPAPGVDEP